MKVLRKGDPKTPPGSVYIGRPSPFGNPYPINETTTREEAIRKYEEYFKKEMLTNKIFRAKVEKLRGAASLVCWCSPLPCHGNIIARYLTGQLKLE